MNELKIKKMNESNEISLKINKYSNLEVIISLIEIIGQKAKESYLFIQNWESVRSMTLERLS